MTSVTVFNCDGPSCLASDDNSGDEHGLMEAGWIIVSMVDDEEEQVAQLCSFSCLAEWAQENVS